MNVAFQTHWLEAAIGEKRSPAEIAQAIASHPEFQAPIAESVRFARQAATAESQETRIIAEHIVSRLYQTMGDFTTMHWAGGGANQTLHLTGHAMMS